LAPGRAQKSVYRLPDETGAVEVVDRRGALEVEQGGLVLAPIVQQVREVDTRFGVLEVELERAAQPIERAALVGESVGGVADAGGGLRRFRVPRDRYFEEASGLIQDALAEQRAADLEHEVVSSRNPSARMRSKHATAPRDRRT